MGKKENQGSTNKKRQKIIIMKCTPEGNKKGRNIKIINTFKTRQFRANSRKTGIIRSNIKQDDTYR